MSEQQIQNGLHDKCDMHVIVCMVTMSRSRDNYVWVKIPFSLHVLTPLDGETLPVRKLSEVGYKEYLREFDKVFESRQGFSVQSNITGAILQ